MRAPRLVLLFLFTAAFALFGAPQAAGQLTQERTPGLRLLYIDGSETFLVPHTTRTALNSLGFQKKLFGFDPHEDVTVLLVDLSDKGNAGASTVPNDLVTVQIAPIAYIFETIATNERMNTLMNHELVHVATMDQSAGRDRTFRRLFRGKVLPVAEQPESVLYFYLTAPRVAAPRWFHEGIAVFVDTWMAGGLGRAQSGYDEMVFRSMVKDGAPFYDPLGLVSEGTKVDFQLETNSYLYGTRFMTWLARRYSPEKVIAWTARRDGSRAYYSSAFRQQFGIGLSEAWAHWVKDEYAFQQANLTAIRQHPVTQYRDVTERALGSVSRAYYDNKTKKIFAAFNYPGVVSHVGAIDASTGAIERLVAIKGPAMHTVASLAWDPDDRVLFYTTDNNAWRDLMRLDPATGKTRLLQTDARIGDIVYDRTDKSLLGIRHFNGICTLVRVRPPYTRWEQVYSWPYGTVVYDLDVSPDGTRIAASFGDVAGKQDVRVISLGALRDGDAAPVAQFDFGPSVPNNFTFSPDGRYLYGSSYYTGVSNIFRYDLDAKKIDAVSNTETGFVRPVPLGGDALLVFRFSGRGFVPATIDAKPIEDIGPITFLGERLSEEHPVVREWNVGSPLAIPYDSLKKDVKPYRLLGNLRPESIYPIVQGYKDTAAVGMRLNFSDAVRLNRASLVASVTPGQDLPSSERVHLKAEYQRYDWRGYAELNNADFYDLFGPTKVSRKGYVFGLGHTNTLIYDEPRRLELDLDGSLSGNLDQLPEYQNVAVDINALGTLDATLKFSDVRNSLGNVDDETGVRWNFNAQGYIVHGSFIPRFRGDYHRGFALPLGHSSIWFRESGGFSPRDRSEPLANFFFGGFGNNYVDHADEKRYREYYAFPGADLNEIGGRNYLKSTVELNLPPWRFQRAGKPGFYATWMRPALFVTGLATDLDDENIRRTAIDAGGQLDFRFTMLSVLDMTLSVGGAVAFEDGHQPRREAMISLKVLR
jgi:WD40-like Beta Propeller Repeat